MDNSQNVHQEQEPTVVEPRVKAIGNRAQSKNLIIVFYWILLFFIGLTVCLGVAISGYNDLSSVENSQPDESSVSLEDSQDTNSTSLTPEPITKPSDHGNPLNLFMGIAIAGCCTTSLLIIFQWRKRS